MTEQERGGILEVHDNCGPVVLGGLSNASHILITSPVHYVRQKTVNTKV